MTADHTLVQSVLGGDRRALARLITRVENQAPGAFDAVSLLYPHTGHAYLVGITGAPGTGKSTVVNAYTRSLRAAGFTVAIVAVDPSSPFSGGAVLGDRIRMTELAGDRGVFIRSMASRGSLGGLAAAIGDVVRVLDAAGFDYVLIETVGAGQSEVDIARMAYTTVVVDAPGMGDDVQAIKAGILEIADILVVNKADRPGVKNTVRTLRAMLDLGHRLRTVGHHSAVVIQPGAPPAEQVYDFWDVPILETIATEAAGLDTLREVVEQHRAHLQESGTLADRERERVVSELSTRLRDTLLARLLDQRAPDVIEDVIRRMVARELDPGSAVRELINGR
ncbi:MAG: methylmalonyl Co-A mutase-associated GTPase MeaB [Anaerolineae bacterium]|nr:methylmalonyl Co-A mutase-associated GTPase MeaB [Anaerolineae bacterium]